MVLHPKEKAQMYCFFSNTRYTSLLFFKEKRQRKSFEEADPQHCIHAFLSLLGQLTAQLVQEFWIV